MSQTERDLWFHASPDLVSLLRRGLRSQADRLRHILKPGAPESRALAKRLHRRDDDFARYVSESVQAMLLTVCEVTADTHQERYDLIDPEISREPVESVIKSYLKIGRANPHLVASLLFRDLRRSMKDSTIDLGMCSLVSGKDRITIVPTIEPVEPETEPRFSARRYSYPSRN